MVSRNRAGVPVRAPRSTSTRSPPTGPVSLLPPSDWEVGGPRVQRTCDLASSRLSVRGHWDQRPGRLHPKGGPEPTGVGGALLRALSSTGVWRDLPGDLLQARGRQLFPAPHPQSKRSGSAWVAGRNREALGKSPVLAPKTGTTGTMGPLKTRPGESCWLVGARVAPAG